MRRTKDGRRIGTVIACIATSPLYISSAHAYELFAMLLRLGAFSYAMPSYGNYTGHSSNLSRATIHPLLSVRCSTLRDARTKRRSKPPRVRAGLQVANDTPLADSSYLSPSHPGVRSVFGIVEIVLCYNNAIRHKCRNGLIYIAPLMGAMTLHCSPLPRREHYRAMAHHGRAPRKCRRRPMYNKGGAVM